MTDDSKNHARRVSRREFITLLAGTVAATTSGDGLFDSNAAEAQQPPDAPRGLRLAKSHYLVKGPAHGEVGSKVNSNTKEVSTMWAEFTITPLAPFPEGCTISFSDGLPASKTGTFSPPSLTWGAGEGGAAKSFRYNPRRVGKVGIKTSNNQGLGDPDPFPFEGLMQTGTARVPIPLWDIHNPPPGYDLHDKFWSPDLGGYLPFTDAEGNPKGPLGELYRSIYNDKRDIDSDSIISCIGDYQLRCEGIFGSGSSNVYDEMYKHVGMTFYVVPGDQKKVPIIIDNAAEGPYTNVSDPGLFPIPDDAQVQACPHSAPTSDSSGDGHLAVLDRDNLLLYEAYKVYKDPERPGVWHASCAAIYDLANGGGGCRQATPLYGSIEQYEKGTPLSNPDAVCPVGHLRREGWAGSDAGGLPVTPFTLRYDEVVHAQAIGPDEPIHHALRATFHNYSQIQFGVKYIYPLTNTGLWGLWPYQNDRLLYGSRIRLRREWWLANREKYGPFARTVLATLAHYGMFVSDGGTAFAITATIDSRWPYTNDDLRALYPVPPHHLALDRHAFEIVEFPFGHTLTVSPDTTSYDPATDTYTPVQVTLAPNPTLKGRQFPPDGLCYISHPGQGRYENVLAFKVAESATGSWTPTVKDLDAAVKDENGNDQFQLFPWPQGHGVLAKSAFVKIKDRPPVIPIVSRTYEIAAHCFKDLAGTIPAQPGDLVACWTDRTGANLLRQPDASKRPILSNNGTLTFSNGAFLSGSDTGLPRRKDPRTVAVWIKPDALGRSQYPVTYGAPESNNSGVLLAVTFNGIPMLILGGAEQYVMGGTPSVKAGEWNLYVVTFHVEPQWAQPSWFMYLNSMSSAVGSRWIATTTRWSELSVGATSVDPNAYFAGEIGTLSIYDRVLSTEELEALKAAGPTGVV